MDKVKEKLQHLRHSQSKDEDHDLTEAQKIVEETRSAEALPAPAAANEPHVNVENVDAEVSSQAAVPEATAHADTQSLRGADAPSIAGGASIRTTQTESRRIHQFIDHFEAAIDPGEQLIAAYSAALRDRVLIQGHLFVSTKHIAFASELIGLKRRIIHSFKEVTAVNRKTTLKVIPNAVTIDADGQTYTFTSLLSREATYDLIMGQWKEHNLDAYNAFVADEDKADADNDLQAMEKLPKGVHPATKSNSKPLAEVALDVRLPTTPVKAYELIWKNADFIRKFMEGPEKLTDVKIGEWEGNPPKRKYSYIKPLNNSVGPKETDCSLEDEEKFADPEKYYEHFTITKTPNVPSGDSFEVHTQTVISWAGGAKGGCKVLVTTEVKWTGRSMLKGVITKASVDGQKQYHKDLAKDVRAHIKANAAEYADGDVGDASADDELEDDEEEGENESRELLENLMELPNDPVKMILAILVFVFALTTVILAFKLRSARQVGPSAGVKLDRNAAERLQAMEAFLANLKRSIAEA